MVYGFYLIILIATQIISMTCCEASERYAIFSKIDLVAFILDRTIAVFSNKYNIDNIINWIISKLAFEGYFQKLIIGVIYLFGSMNILNISRHRKLMINSPLKYQYENKELPSNF